METVSTQATISRNISMNGEDDDYIFDRTYVRVIFFILYGVVFCLCVFGNLLVILVVTMSRRLRSITNFFLANLAVADFCVGIFCVFQNLSIYLINDWVIGDFLCKMYQFINTMSYTASIFILVVICTERYFAIIYPITCKQILTPKRLRLVILAVWILSAAYSSPKFYWSNTVRNVVGNKTEHMCISNRKKYNSELFDMIHFLLLYVIPLAVMSLLYSRIAVCLWRSSRALEKQMNVTPNVTSKGHQSQCTRFKQHYAETKISSEEGRPLQNTTNILPNPNSSKNVLRARRGVIKMLIIVVLTFALCNLPLHARKMWQYWTPNFQGDNNFSAMLTPLTFLVAYFNSGINPLLYAFLSRNFRRGMREILLCYHGNRKQQSLRKHNTIGLHTGALHRQASTRSTLKNNVTTVTMLNHEASSECSHEL